MTLTPLCATGVWATKSMRGELLYIAQIIRD